MDQINYVGEHLWAGKLGHFIVLATFISSILSAVSYYFFVKKEEKGWLILGRSAFITHSVAVFSVIGLIFFINASKLASLSKISNVLMFSFSKSKEFFVFEAAQIKVIVKPFSRNKSIN